MRAAGGPDPLPSQDPVEETADVINVEARLSLLPKSITDLLPFASGQDADQLFLRVFLIILNAWHGLGFFSYGKGMAGPVLAWVVNGLSRGR